MNERWGAILLTGVHILNLMPIFCPSITYDPFEDGAILKNKNSVFLCTFQTKTLLACSDLCGSVLPNAQTFHISRWHFCRSTGVCFDMEIYDIQQYYMLKSTKPFLLH